MADRMTLFTKALKFQSECTDFTDVIVVCLHSLLVRAIHCALKVGVLSGAGVTQLAELSREWPAPQWTGEYGRNELQSSY